MTKLPAAHITVRITPSVRNDVPLKEAARSDSPSCAGAVISTDCLAGMPVERDAAGVNRSLIFDSSRPGSNGVYGTNGRIRAAAKMYHI